MRITLLAILLLSPPAAAEESDPPVGLSIAAGIATALVPLAIGSTLISNTSDQSLQNTGMYVMVAGLALAPFVSHAVSREFARGALFSALPAAAAVAMIALLQVVPDVIADQGGPESRLPFGISLIAGVLGSAGGIADSFLAGDRAHARRVSIVPTVSSHQVGLAIGGSL